MDETNRFSILPGDSDRGWKSRPWSITLQLKHRYLGQGTSLHACQRHLFGKD